MAATYGRWTGKAGVCLSKLGPGATNFVTSAAYAQLGGMPTMMMTRRNGVGWPDGNTMRNPGAIVIQGRKLVYRQDFEHCGVMLDTGALATYADEWLQRDGPNSLKITV